MLRRFTLGLAVSLMPFASAALDLENMSAAEREAFNQAVQDYLMSNPQVIIDAVDVLRARELEAQAAADRDLVREAIPAFAAIEDAYVGGDPEGEILFVEFLDYNCGFCRRFHPVTQAMLADNDGIRHIVLEFPIQGPDSDLSARFAISLRSLHGDAMYKAFHDTLMALDVAADAGILEEVATGLGLEVEPILAGMNAETVDAELRRNRELAQMLQIQGTPSWILGDELGRGYVPLNELQAVLDQQTQADG